MTKHSDSDEFHVLIPASGKGERFGSEIPKQYLEIAGKSVLRHTIEKFIECPGLKSLRVIINPDHEDLYRTAVEGLDLPNPIHGSTQRNLSVYNGLNTISHLKNEEKVLIHDAVRPFISNEDILKIVHALNDNEAVSLGTPMRDTLRKDQEIIEREGIWAVQTPQGFQYRTIIEAHEKGRDLKVTDDTALVSALGIPVKMIEGSKTNFKITDRDDFAMAQTFLKPQTQIRTGFGYDVHAFEKDRPLILCGIEIDHEFGLKGHSDADVGLHAITDALLASIAQGDIGSHFPPSNPDFKDMDSTVFLKKAAELLQDNNATINNIDLTLICEEPKIGPHRDQMRSRIADILDIDTSRISVKATTSEGLGFTGRKEGIAAQAVATIEIQEA